MNVCRRLSSRTKRIGSAVAGVGLLLLLIMGWPLRRPIRLSAVDPAQTADVRVVNMTKSFAVVQTSVTGRNKVGSRRIGLFLRNDYDKTVTGYVVGQGGGHCRTDLTNTSGIPPGGTVEFPDSTPPPPQDTDVVVTVLAVMLEDGSGDGDPTIVQEFMDARAGEVAQERRIKLHLERLATVPDERFSAELDALKARILELPRREAGRSFHYNAALADIREGELNHVDDLQRIQREHGNDTCRDIVRGSIGRKNAKIAKLTPHKVER